VLANAWVLDPQNGNQIEAQMKAFLSHSSKDKAFVQTVANYLGEALCEYDTYTFDYTLTSHNIRSALSKCDLFVLFLSENSINSSFVSEEMRTALEFRGSGRIKKVMIIALDATSYQSLPEWMRSINVATKLTSALTVGRRIEAELLVLDTESEAPADIYIPREDEEANLRRALRKPPGDAPIAIHAVGHLGIGRKPF
jgi:TIR domain